MVLAQADIKYRKSLANLGGAIQVTEISDATKSNLFPKVSKSEADSGEIRYAAFYVYNSNTTTSMKNPIAKVAQDSTSTNDEIWIGWDPAGVNATMQTIANQLTPPTNVLFKNGATRSDGAILGADIPPLGYAGIWAKNIIKFNAGSTPNDTTILNIETDNLQGAIDLPDSITFCCVGESDCNSTYTTIVKKIKNRTPDFVVLLGNNNFSSDASCVFNTWGADWIKKIYPVIGVQENSSTTKYNQYKNKWPDLLNNVWGYYSRDIANLHILVMDSNHSWGTQSDQYDFIVRDLDRANANVANDWIIAFIHQDFWSSGTQYKADHPGAVYTETGQVKYDIYLDMFNKKNVSMVFAAWAQNLEIENALQFMGSDTINNPPVANFASQKPHYTIPQGQKSFLLSTMLHIVGTGGKGHHAFKNGLFADQTASPVQSDQYATDSTYGYVYVKIVNTPTKKMTVSFYDTTDKLKYQFDITKL